MKPTLAKALLLIVFLSAMPGHAIYQQILAEANLYYDSRFDGTVYFNSYGRETGYSNAVTLVTMALWFTAFGSLVGRRSDPIHVQYTSLIGAVPIVFGKILDEWITWGTGNIWALLSCILIFSSEKVWVWRRRDAASRSHSDPTITAP